MTNNTSNFISSGGIYGTSGSAWITAGETFTTTFTPYVSSGYVCASSHPPKSKPSEVCTDENIISRKEVLDILEFWKVCLLNQEESREKMLDSIIEEVSKMAPAPFRKGVDE